MEREEEQREEEEAVKKEVKYNEQLKVLEEQEEQRNQAEVPLLRLFCLKKFFWNPEPPPGPEPERELEPEPPLEPKTFKIKKIQIKPTACLRRAEIRAGSSRPAVTAAPQWPAAATAAARRHTTQCNSVH